MLLIVGLGNPGDSYQHNRHNIGFMAADAIADAHRFGPAKSKFRGQLREGTLSGRHGVRKTLVLKPMTFMNASGKAVAGIVRFYKIPLEDLIVICDDLSLPLGRVRIRPGGGDGGQKGLRDISRVLGTDKFPRMRIGIGDRGLIDAADFVLAKFRPSESKVLEDGLLTAIQAIGVWAARDLETAMNRFNGPSDPQASPAKS